MKRRKCLAILLFSILVVSVMWGNAGSAFAADKIVFGISMNTLSNPFFVDVKDGCEKAAKELGIELIITDAQNDPSIQQKNVENLITKKPALIILDPADSDAIVASVEACNVAKIPVFTMDREANGGEVISHIGYDMLRSGRIAGQFIADELGGKGKVVEIQGIMGANSAQQRSAGFNEIISKYNGIEIVARQVANFDRAEGMSVMENILQANPHIDGLYAANDEMMLGALEAIEAVGRRKEMKIIGCDAIDGALEAIRAGKADATIAEPPFFLGKARVQTCYDWLQSKKVEPLVILENQLVTAQNVNTIVTKE